MEKHFKSGESHEKVREMETLKRGHPALEILSDIA